MTTPYQTDPLVCLCKLAILSFMPVGTKLAFGRHTIRIQSHTGYQWLERSLSRDSRSDISLLETPLSQVVQYYLPQHQDDETRDLVRYAIRGLELLRDQTYSDTQSVRIIIQYYINHLTASLEGRWREDELLSRATEPVTLETPSYQDTVNTVSRMLQDADKSERSSEDARALITCTYSLLQSREKAYAHAIGPKIDWIE